MSERWRLVARNPRYQVSDLGRIKRTATGRVLKPTQNSKQGKAGYLKISLGNSRKPGSNAYVHQLVAEAFLGPRPDGHDVEHLDHNRSNNRVANLTYLPLRENRMAWTGPGRKDFEVAKHLPPPDEHVPMTEEEHEHYQREHVAAGW